MESLIKNLIFDIRCKTDASHLGVWTYLSSKNIPWNEDCLYHYDSSAFNQKKMTQKVEFRLSDIDFPRTEKTIVQKPYFLENTKKSKTNFVEKDFVAKIFNYTRKIENLKLYKMEYLVFNPSTLLIKKRKNAEFWARKLYFLMLSVFFPLSFSW